MAVEDGAPGAAEPAVKLDFEHFLALLREPSGDIDKQLYKFDDRWVRRELLPSSGDPAPRPLSNVPPTCMLAPVQCYLTPPPPTPRSPPTPTLSPPRHRLSAHTSRQASLRGDELPAVAGPRCCTIM